MTTVAIDMDGTPAGEWLDGDLGHDTLRGLGGDDTLRGFDGDDLLEGGDGYDRLIGDGGNDTLNGGADVDWVDYRDAAGPVSVDLATGTATTVDGNDTLIAIEGVYGSPFDDLLVGARTTSGGAGNDTLRGTGENDHFYDGEGANTFAGGNGFDTVVFARADGAGLPDAPVVVDLPAGSITVGGQVQTVYSIERFEGGSDADLFVGAARADQFLGGDGDDTLTGNGGADFLSGGEGNNRLSGGSGADTLFGGYGDDTLYGGTGDDSLDGGGGTDHVFAGAGNDRIRLDNQLSGSIDGGDGWDILELGETEYSAWYGAWIYLGGGSAMAPGRPVYVSVYGFEEVLAGYGNDVIAGSAAANRLFGGIGLDTLYGEGGNDTLQGWDDDDLLIGGLGSDTFVVDTDLIPNVDTIMDFSPGDRVLLVDAYAGDTRINADAASIRLDYASGITTLSNLPGYTGNWTLRLQGQYDAASLSFENTVNAAGDAELVLTLVGHTTWTGTGTAETGTGTFGRDHLIGLGGNDTLLGDLGADTLEGGAGHDVLDGGAGVDRMLGGAGNDSYRVDDPYDQVWEFGREGFDTVTATVSYVLPDGVEKLVLAGSAVAGTGNYEDNVLLGNAADNVLDGAWGRDTLVGGAGSDVYHVDEWNDVVIEKARAGNDGVVSTASDFTLPQYVEWLTLDGAAVQGIGNMAANVITGNALNNVLRGGWGGADTLRGLDGDDLLDGVDGNDLLEGGAGADTLLGAMDDDQLLGGDGDDVLEGGSHADQMTGGAGADVFQFYPMAGRADVIHDFEPGVDRIALSEGVNASIVTDPSALLLLAWQDGADTMLELSDDVMVRLVGVTASQLTSGDFVPIV